MTKSDENFASDELAADNFAASPITLLLMELDQNFNVQRVPCGKLNTLR